MRRDGAFGRVKKTLLIVFVLGAALVLGTIGFRTYRNEARGLWSEKLKNLKSVAEMKAGQIAAWRTERLSDARLFSSNLIGDAIIRWIQSPGDASKESVVRSQMNFFRENYGYQNIVLAAPDGRVLLSLEPGLTALEDIANELVLTAATSGEAAFGNFFRCPVCGRVHLDVAAPVLDEARRPAAVILLRTDPEIFLYPLIQSWPVPSGSAETLLVRREDDHVLILNTLRFRPDPALTVRLPLTRKDVPAVRAVTGVSGEYVGRDYSGVEVLSHLSRIPGSDWHMVAKMELKEILAESRYRGRMILLLVALGILMAGGLAALFYNRRHRSLLRTLYLSERAKQDALEKSRREFERLRSLADILKRHDLPTREFLEYALDESLKLTESRIGHIYFYHEDKKEFVLNAWSKDVMKECAVLNPRTCCDLEKTGVWDEAVRQRRPIVLNDYPKQHPLKKDYPEGHVKILKFLAVPLFKGDAVAAVVGVANKATDYDETDVLQLSLLMDGVWKMVELRQAEERARASLAETSRLLQDAERARLVLLSVVEDRRAAEDEIRKLNVELERRVRDRTAQLEAANRELEAFAYSASHDLRAPLRGIDGWSLALLEDYHDKLDEKGRRFLERIRSEAQRMGRLIDDLLRFSRETRGELIWQSVDLTAAAEAVASRLLHDNSSPEARVSIQPGLTVRGDARLLEIAIGNLLDNALKFSRHRPGATVEFGRVELEGKEVFFVRDNGVGFDMAYASKLFTMFQRLHSASEFPGTGVGLATVQRIINRHGGRIWADAAPGKGATFYFTLEESA